MMGLRLGEGIDAGNFRAVTGGAFADHLDGVAIARLAQAGYLSVDGDRLAATKKGRLRLDAVIASLLRGPAAGRDLVH